MSWQEYGIEEVCELIVDCVNRTAPVVDYETSYKMIRTSNVRDGWIDMSDARNVTKDTYEIWTRRAVPRQGDVVLTREAPLGEVGLIRMDEPVFLGQRTVMYRANPEKMLPHFLYYSLLGHGVQAQIQAFGFGSTVSHMRVPDAKKLQLKAPDTATQEKIIHVMDAYDTMIEANQRRIQLLEEAVRLLYREWFVKLRFPGHETVQVTDQVPEGWERGTAHDFVSVLSGGTPRTGYEHYWDGGIPFFTPKDCPGTYYVTETEKTLTETGLESCNSRLFPKETIFVTARGTVGKIVLAQQPMAMNQSCYALVPKQNYDNLFLFLAMKDAVEHFKQVASGGVFSAIVVDTFKIIPFVKPPSDLTDEFGRLVRPIFDQLETVIRQNIELQKVRDMLLPRLMSGALDVSRISVAKEVEA